MGGGGRVPLVVFLILFSGACATAGGPSPTSSVDADRFDSWIPTLLVENASGDPIAVRLNGTTLGTATVGRNCMLIPLNVGEIVFEFVPVGMDPELAWPVHLEQSRHWHVNVGPGDTLKRDLSSLAPAESSCQT